MIKKCFWTSIRFQFPEIIDTPIIGLRKGWQVVTVDTVQSAKRELLDLVNEIFSNE